MKQILHTLLLMFSTHVLAGQISSDTLSTSVTDTLEAMGTEVEVLFSAGKYREAAMIAINALDLVGKAYGEDDLNYGDWLDAAGVTLHNAGSLKEALYYLQAGVEHARTHLGENHEDYVTRLSNLGMLHKDMGDYGEMLRVLEMAVSKGKKVLGEAHPYYGVLVNNLALAYESVGQFERALEYYKQALIVTEKTLGKEHEKYGIRLHNIGSTYYLMGQYERAIPFFEQALKIYEKTVDKEHPLVFATLANLAQASWWRKDYERALQISKEVEARAAIKLGRLHPDYARYLMDLGLGYEGMRQYAQAKAVLSEVENIVGQIFGQCDNWRQANKLYMPLARINEGLGSLPDARAYHLKIFNQFILETRNKFDQLNQAEQESYLDKYKLGFSFSFALNHPDQTEIVEKSFDVNLVVKGLTLGYRRLLLKSLRVNDNAAKIAGIFDAWQTLGAELARQYSRPSDKRLPELSQMQARYEALERELITGSAAFREARQPIGWQQVRQALNEGEAAIEFCHFRYYGAAARLMSDSTLYIALLLRKSDPRPQLIYLFEEKQLGDFQALRNLYALQKQGSGANLNELIWQPLAPYLAGIKRIYYSNSGILHRVNLGAIPVNNHQIISDRFQLYALGSTRQLALPRETPYYGQADAVLFGGIEYGKDSSTKVLHADANPAAGFSPDLGNSFRSLRNKDWPFLDWTAKEVANIKTILEQFGFKASIRTGYEASETAVKQIGKINPAPRVLHLATHGYFFPDADTAAATGFQSSRYPLIRSGLILAGANSAWKGESLLAGQEDGILTAYEIAQLDLSKTELVVLSACETGLGELQGNEGICGLQRAFKMAGARYILMSLWKVSDHYAYEFMNLFYREWLEHGRSIPRAFQLAQNRMREQYDQPSNPSIWAGFILLD